MAAVLAAQEPKSAPRQSADKAAEKTAEKKGDKPSDRTGAKGTERRTSTKPQPDCADFAYGPHERNILDLWKAKSDKPTPLVIFIHGGGFRGGSKDNLDGRFLDLALKAGISVASINYRLSQHAPFPGPMLDGARAVQFLRTKVKEWNLDPKRIAAMGSSAGAGISLWIAFHDDLADPKSSDPILRESSRVACAAVIGAQSSYDPRWIRENIGGRAYEHQALTQFYGITQEELDTPKSYKLYEEASAINYLTADDPPVFMVYNEPKEKLPPGPNTGPTLNYPDFGKRITGQPQPGAGIHHPRFGYLLKEKMDALKIECIVRHTDDYKSKDPKGDALNSADEEMVAFLVNRLKPEQR